MVAGLLRERNAHAARKPCLLRIRYRALARRL
jgi:hypothetical protein